MSAVQSWYLGDASSCPSSCTDLVCDSGGTGRGEERDTVIHSLCPPQSTLQKKGESGIERKQHEKIPSRYFCNCSYRKKHILGFKKKKKKDLYAIILIRVGIWDIVLFIGTLPTQAQHFPLSCMERRSQKIVWSQLHGASQEPQVPIAKLFTSKYICNCKSQAGKNQSGRISRHFIETFSLNT